MSAKPAITGSGVRQASRPSLVEQWLSRWPSAILVLAFDTWRRAWRESMTRMELYLLLLLDVVAGIAAIGSPTAGDGAVQMLAVCFMVVPFALVLVAGQIWRRQAQETALWSRGLDAVAYVVGRALGLFAIALAMLAVVDVLGTLMLVAVAHLGLSASLSWDTSLILKDAVPSAVFITGGTVLLVTLTGGGSRYYAPAILLSLALAFYEYKVPYLALGAGGGLTVWSPFPALLTLGLALPPALLVPHAAWLVPNRVLYTGLGLAFLGLAAWKRGQSRETPLLRTRVVDAGALLVALIVLVGLIWTGVAAVQASPPTLPQETVTVSELDTARISGGQGTLALHVAAVQNHWQGQESAVLTLSGTGPRQVYFWLNRGLTVSHVTIDGKRGSALVMGGGQAAPGLAAALYALPPLSPGTHTVTVAYAGTLAPVYSLLPVMSGAVGTLQEGAYAGPGRLFLNGTGTWYPAWLQQGGGLAPVTLRIQGLQVTGISSQDKTAVSAPAWTGGGVLPKAVMLVGPYQTETVGGVAVYTRHLLTTPMLASLSTYAKSVSRLEPWLPPDDRGPARIVMSPLAVSPQWAGGALIAPEDHPYCIPPNPVLGGCGANPAGSLTSLLQVSELAWRNTLGVTDGNLPQLAVNYGRTDQRQTLLPLLAVATAVRATTGTAVGHRLLSLVQHQASLPGLGTPPKSLWPELQSLTTWAASESPGLWQGFVSQIQKAAAQRGFTWAVIQHAE